VPWPELTEEERFGTLAPFDEQISPVLIPLGVDPTHPFPFVSGSRSRSARSCRRRTAVRDGSRA
jgi:polyphosphate kinase